MNVTKVLFFLLKEITKVCIMYDFQKKKRPFLTVSFLYLYNIDFLK